MWFIGLVLGLFVGAVFGHDFWVLGAVVGAVVGWWIGEQRGPKEEKPKRIDERIEALSAELKDIRRRLSALEAGSFTQSTPETQLPPEPVAVPGLVQTPQPAIETPAVAPAAAAESAKSAPVPILDTPTASTSDNFITAWLFGGNTLVRVGAIILFFGVAFLLKYAYEHTHVPIELRLAGVASGGIVLLVIGWKLRVRREGYALTLQGAGVGVLYLTLFAAFRLYDLLPPTLALLLLLAVSVFSAVLAVVQDSKALAVTSVTGGFLAPILTSTGGGSHVMLFSYYALLNVGILGIAWYKAWRALNILGFAFTFVIGMFWGVNYYRPEHFATVEPFLALFFLFYVMIPILFARKRAVELKSYVDGTLVFGVPLVAFGLQAALVRDFEYGSAFSAIALAAYYLSLASVLYTRTGGNLKLLVEAFIALGVVFATLAIPLAFEGRLTSAAWALEGAAIVWIGMRQNRLLARAFGMALQFAAGLAFLVDVDRGHGTLPIANSFYLGCLFLAVGALFCSAYLERNRERIRSLESVVVILLFVWGILWWLVGGLHEIHLHVDDPYRHHAVLMFFTLSCAGFSLLHRQLEWRSARIPALALVPLLAIVLLTEFGYGRHPFVNLGFVAWPLGFTVHLWLLKRHESEYPRLGYWWHAIGLWLFAVVASWEVGWNIDNLVEGQHVWPLIAWALVPGLLLAFLATRSDESGWPFGPHRDAYVVAGGTPVAVFLGLWTVYANFTNNGSPAPLPYLPLLNPLDIAQVGAFLVLFHWLQLLRRDGRAALLGSSPTLTYSLFGAAAFIWANGVLLRTLHHWAAVPFALDAMLRSVLVQAAFSIFWSLLALVLMLFATRRGVRGLWMTGAGLMAVVVAKLFLVDLSNIGGVERIVSFIGVGLLMLLIGYLSPVPPKTNTEIK